MAVDITAVKESRLDTDFILETRGFRIEGYQDWKTRMRDLDSLYKGDYLSRSHGDMVYDNEGLSVMNLVQVGMDDISRLVTESVPVVRCMAVDDTETAAENANVREAICDTYWRVNDGEQLIPRLAMDLAGAGAAFVVINWDDDSPYPCFHRIDPRYAYPDVYNGQLQDLLVVREMPVRQAARLFPFLELSTRPEVADSAEVLEYYSADECVQAVAVTRGGKPVDGGTFITKRWKPKLKRVPVAFAQLDTYDGQFRGMFDQIFNSLITKNRIIRQVLDYTDQMVYAPLVSKGVLNEKDKPGPKTHYRLDPNTPDAQIGRMQPAGAAPQLFALLDYLDREQRGGTGYPVQRQGEVSQSIASAAFVNSTMGQLTTTVRNIQRLLANIRTRANEIALEVDEQYLNFNKPLVRSVGKKKSYTPGLVIKGRYMNLVTYGAGAGLDRMNADVRIIQHQGAGIISRETAREHVDFLLDPAEEHTRIEKEATEGALMQKLLSEAPVEMLMDLQVLQAEGYSLTQAVAKLREKEQAAPPAGGMAAGGTPMEAQTMPGASTQQTALSKGGVPGNADKLREVDFQPPPITNVVVKPTGA